ncbi:hypothetical protein GW17_00024534 [Ensete ventricosum]|nr:hypothetical protein GW17_00024534 [Ensete ventricosum]
MKEEEGKKRRGGGRRKRRRSKKRENQENHDASRSSTAPLDDPNPGGNGEAAARVVEEAVSFIASFAILRLLHRILCRRPETSSPNVVDEVMKEIAFFSSSKVTRRRGEGDHYFIDIIAALGLVLKVELEAPVPSIGSFTRASLLHHIMKILALAASTRNQDNNHSNTSREDSYIRPLILQLLIIWLADCPNAVYCFLEAPEHIAYLLGLISSPHAGACVQGLAATILGECVVYNKNGENNRDAFAVVDALNQKVELTSFFLKFDKLQKSLKDLTTLGQHRKPPSRSSSASMADAEEVDTDDANQKHQHPVIVALFDPVFIGFIERLEADIRESILGIFSTTKNKVAVLPVELEQMDKETDGDYVRRLRAFIEKQCDGMQKAKIEAEVSNYRNLTTKLECCDLKSLSDAYNGLEQSNFRLETEAKALRKGEDVPYPDTEAIKAEAREETEKENEAELNDLLVCLGQEAKHGGKTEL